MVARLAAAWAIAWLTLAAVPAASLAQEDDESALYVDEAREAMAKKDHARAGKLLDRAIATNPRRIDAYVLRATVHVLEKQYAEGIAVLRRARALAPDNPHVLTMLGTQLLWAGKADEAVPLLEDVVRRWPDRYEAWAALGHRYERTGAWAQAIRAFEAYFRTRPASLGGEDWKHQVALANAHLRSGAPGRARDLYREVLARNEKSVLGWLGLAWSIAAIDCGEALPLFAGMTDLAGKYPQVLLVHARCAIVLGRAQEALALAQRYNERRPGDAQSWGLLGEARMATGDLAGARAALEEAVRLAPTDKVYAFRLARAERLLGQPAAAALRLRQAGPPEGYETDWNLELAEAYHADGKAAEVVGVLRPFVTQNPRVAAARVLLGIALLETGDAAGAIIELETGLMHDPQATRAKRPLMVALNVEGVASFKRGDMDSAERLLSRAAALGDDVTTLRNLGGIRLLAGKADDALSALERAAGLPGADATVHHLLGRAQHALGKSKLAAATLRKALAFGGLENHDATTVAIRIDLASVLVASGEAGEAVDALAPALEARDAALRAQVFTAWSVASRAAATQWMRAGGFARAYAQLEALEKQLPENADAEVVLAVRCDLALAATGAGKRDDALKRLRQLEKSKVKCPYAAPADKLAVTILIAWNEGSRPGRASAALKRLNELRRAATGPARPLVREAARFIAMRAAADQYAVGATARARGYLAIAAGWEDTPSAEMTVNLAAIMMEDGEVDHAIRDLEPLAGKVPEALVHLALAWDKKGEPLRALDYFRKALAAGVSFAPLRTWVAARERLWGGGQ